MRPVLTPTLPGAAEASLARAGHQPPQGITAKSAPATSGPSSAVSPELVRAAREFEAVFLRTLLGSLEKTTQLGSGGGLSSGQSAYGSMVVSAMADSLSAAGGIGLSDVITQALLARSPGPPPKSQ